MKSSHKKSINEIMKEFDFKKVNETMKLMEWKWVHEDRFEVPALARIKKRAKRLLNDVANDPRPDCWHGTGGFKAEKLEEDYFLLSFVLTDWDNFDEETEIDEGIDKEIKKASKRFSSPFEGIDL